MKFLGLVAIAKCHYLNLHIPRSRNRDSRSHSNADGV